MAGTLGREVISTRPRKIAELGATSSEAIIRGAGCPNWARPDLWEPRVGNCPRPPDHESESGRVSYCHDGLELPLAARARSVLGVSPSGFYAWCRRGRSAREESDEALSARVRAIHQRSRGTYGAPRIHAELAAEGTPVSRKRVARFRSLRELAR